jgi:predicted ATP-grasp superfamily ATP-dependent carboligase
MAMSPRALIVCTGRDRGALAGARALHDAGWSVGAGTPTGSGMVTASRAVSASHLVPRPRGDGRAFVTGVRAAVADGAYDVVLGGGDDWMAGLSAYRDEIPTAVAHPPFEAVRSALDKVDLADAAHAVGLGAPHTVAATDDALREWAGPVVVKCRTHWSPGQRRRHRIDARLFPDPHAARAQVEHIRASGAEPVLQEPVEGRLGAVIGLFDDGRLHGRLQQTTSGLWPTPSGMSSRARTVAVDQALVARVERLLSRIGWWGLVELQFLTDATGVPRLIDLNGRFFGSLALTNAARPGLVDAWCRAALGHPVPTLPDAPGGHRYSWLAGDLRRARTERRGGLVPDVLDSLRWGLGAQHSVWDRADPRPTLQLVRERISGEHAGTDEPFLAPSRPAAGTAAAG